MRFAKIWAVTAVFTLALSFFFLVLPTTTFSHNNEIGGEGDMVIEGHWYWLRGHHSGSGETTLSV